MEYDYNGVCQGRKCTFFTQKIMIFIGGIYVYIQIHIYKTSWLKNFLYTRICTFAVRKWLFSWVYLLY